MKHNTLNTLIKLLVIPILTWSATTTAEPPEWAISGEAVEVTGELEVLYFDDFENHRGEQRYFVHDKRQNKRYQLEFQGEPPEQVPLQVPLSESGGKATISKFLWQLTAPTVMRHWQRPARCLVEIRKQLFWWLISMIKPFPVL
ncbi:hypothetical protein BPLS_P2418 [Bathymodiolus platifrons methanotrophic gill symbiont]|nr:hypothetical protein BPLS_P2418 [Bathymodiolus platifrons methanotrophic gill symbiont]